MMERTDAGKVGCLKRVPLFPRAMNASHRHSPWPAFKALPPSMKLGTQATVNVPVDEFLRMALSHQAT